MSAEFKEGDVVRLKSGGPAMTVTGFTDEIPAREMSEVAPGSIGCPAGLVECIWFDEKTGKERKGTYKPALLEKVDAGGTVIYPAG